MKYAHQSILALFSLMMVPSFARGMPAPHPPETGTEPVQAEPEKRPDEPNYPSNVGAVNEGGGSANTNGMSNGLSPNAHGSGTMNGRAGDTSGIPLGGEEPSTGTDSRTGTVEPAD
jgi:hypothetical protein